MTIEQRIAELRAEWVAFKLDTLVPAQRALAKLEQRDYAYAVVIGELGRFVTPSETITHSSPEEEGN